MLLFDGAMGTMKQMGLDTLSIHRAYIEAGCQVVTTDTFMANRLSTSDVEGKNKRALEVTRQAAGETNVLVAGDLGPTVATSKDYPLSSFYELYREQARALKGVDLWLVETVVDLEVARVAVRACLEVDPDVPALVSMIPSVAPEKAMQAFDGFPLSALGYNCGSGPLQSASSLIRLASMSPFPLIWEPSAGLPEQGRYPLGCQEWARVVRSVLAHTPVAYVGGCCGTTPAYIRALAY
ncbi:MAG: homocysteine S-methyltransferase family protein [Sphaerochaetaceae bacterium]|nr:homocysteine S-methyltransferase family protein [Spirochaetales bacterium]MDY5500064.1 homocysteine S-methyltransferase family protein [Sphaerochaetaceae bacterium]